jgi:putative nucleotidyltransferase with HDIG domain
MALNAADITGTSFQRPNLSQLLQELPALPTVSTRLLSIIGRADVDLRSVSALIASDGALAGEVLRIANSSLFGLRSEVRSIVQAVAYLGIEKTKSLAWTVAIKNYLGNALQTPPLQRIWRHSLAVALVAEELANWTQADGAEAYTAGILHDLGALGLIAMSPSHYRQLLEEAAVAPASILDLERKHFGLDHCEAGEFLAAKWKLPPFMGEVMRLHHSPLEQPAFTPLGLIHFASRGADLLGFSVVNRPVEADSPNAFEEFHDQLPPRRKERVVFNLADLELLIAARVNAIES